MEKRLMMFIAGLFLSMGVALAQTQVNGTVTSADDGEPVIGASIRVEGTKTGTVTDVDGHFSISVPANSHLEVSYIGMVSKRVKASQNMRIILESDSKSLDEVMVVAFGTQTKASFTGSAAVVGSEELSKRVTTNVADALVGSVPGLQLRGGSGAPGANQGSMNIRGVASMYAGTDPLIIVDGAPYNSSLSNIAQSDIESISVLKDAASAALYGARGAAGVIIITTKKGSAHKAEVKFDAKWGSNSRAIQDYDVITDPGQYYEAYYMGLYNRNFYGLGQSAADANLNANNTMMSQLVYNVFTVPEGENLIGMNGKLNPNATLGRAYDYNGTTYYLTPDDWTDLAYKNALRQEYNVSVNGGTEKGNFYASLGYLNEDGVIDYSGYERITARLRAEQQLTKWLKVGANVNYNHSRQKSNPNLDGSAGANNIMYFTSMMAPIYPAFVRVMDAEGNVSIKQSEYGNDMYDYGVNPNYYPGIGTRPFLASGNPLAANRYNKSGISGDQLNGSFIADFTITDFLKANITSTIIFGQTNTLDYGNMLEGPSAGTGGTLKKTSTTNWRQNHTQTLTFFKDFGKHNVNVLLGHEWYKQDTQYLGAQMYGGFSPYILELNAFATMQAMSSYTNKYNVEGYFGSAQYNYDNKYFASASYRRDASSRFAKKNRWGDFWSVGAAWIISKEKFMRDITWIDQLKLKASIGQQGNDNIGDFAYVDLYTLNKSDDTHMSPTFARMGNPDITWETTTNFNVGVEFSFWNSRLSGSLEYYNKKTTDLLFWLSVPESIGTRGYYGNMGDIRNQGVELVLNGSIIRSKLVDWDISANIAHNKSEILKLPESKTMGKGGFTESTSGHTYQQWFEVGGELYTPFIAEYAGVNEQGEALYWVDEDLPSNANATPGQKHSYTTTNFQEATRYKQESTMPDFYGGFSTTIRIGDFDASASFDYQIGGKVYDMRYKQLMTPMDTSGNSGQNFHKDVLKSWSPDNTSSNIPRWQAGDQYTSAMSTRWFASASYLNFQSFTVGYTLPKNLIDNIASIRVYVAGENLCFWSARKGLDPRYSYEGQTSMNNVYSPIRNISAGVQVTF